MKHAAVPDFQGERSVASFSVLGSGKPPPSSAPEKDFPSPPPTWEEQSQLLPEDGGIGVGGCFSPASLLMPPTGRTHRGVGDKSASHIESQLGKTLGVSGVVCSAHLRAAGEPGLPPGLSTKEGNSKELKELRSSLPLRCQ